MQNAVRRSTPISSEDVSGQEEQLVLGTGRLETSCSSALPSRGFVPAAGPRDPSAVVPEDPSHSECCLIFMHCWEELKIPADSSASGSL